MAYNRIKELTDKVKREMKSVGIPVSDNIEKTVINKRTKKRLGACLRNKDSFGKETFIIEISAKVLECDDFQLCSIIAHELLHTCPESFNHGKKWKEYGRKTENLLGYHIKRTANLKELNIPDTQNSETVKYVAVCRSCGHRYERRRMCPLIKNPGRYRCGKCGGKLKLV